MTKKKCSPKFLNMFFLMLQIAFYLYLFLKKLPIFLCWSTPIVVSWDVWHTFEGKVSGFSNSILLAYRQVQSWDTNLLTIWLVWQNSLRNFSVLIGARSPWRKIIVTVKSVCSPIPIKNVTIQIMGRLPCGRHSLARLILP